VLADNATEDIDPQGSRDLNQSAHPEARGVFTTRSFGAKADDSTNDTAALDLAYAAANAAKGTLAISPGIHKHDGLDWLNMQCEVVAASRSGAELKLNAGVSRSVVKVTTAGNTDFGRHGPSIRNLKITGNNEQALGNYGLELDDAQYLTMFNSSVNDSGDSLISLRDTTGTSSRNSFHYLTLVPGTKLDELNRPLIEVRGACNYNSFTQLNFFGTQGARDRFGTVGSIWVNGNGALAVGNLFKDLMYQTFSFVTPGAFFTIESARECVFWNSKMWDSPLKTGQVGYRVKRGAGTNTGGHWIVDRWGASAVGPTEGFTSIVEIDDDYCVVEMTLRSESDLVVFKSGAQFNHAVIRGKSGNNPRTIDARQSGAPVVKDNSGNHTNTWYVAYGESRGIMPPRWTTAERADLDAGLAAADEGYYGYNLTTQRLEVWNGSAFVAW